ncbi:hypothetical protein L1887_30377 [Cichorium endivia]|nr:hypothetical protein L1887_30377 [Cichorium endivia]
MADIVKQITARPIQLADKIIKEADFACSYKQECADIKCKTQHLGGLLRQVARANNVCERPARVIIDDTEKNIDKTLRLVFKCQANRLRRMFIIISPEASRISSQCIEYSLSDVSWLLRISTPGTYNCYEGLEVPYIAANQPALCWIWEQIATLCCGTVDDRAEAAATLLSMARQCERYRGCIIEEGGMPPLLKLAREDRVEGQQSAIRAIRLLNGDPEC